jgi:hypothetical protein
MDTDSNITYYIPRDLGVPHLEVDDRGVVLGRMMGVDCVAYHGAMSLVNEIARAVCFSNIEFTVEHLNYLHGMTGFAWDFDVSYFVLHATRKKDDTEPVDPALKRFYATLLFPYYMDQYEEAQKTKHRDVLRFRIDPVTEVWKWCDEAPLNWQDIASCPEDGSEVWLRGHYPHEDPSRIHIRVGLYDSGGYTEGYVDALLNIFYATHWRPISKDIAAIPCPICSCDLEHHPKDSCGIHALSPHVVKVLFEFIKTKYAETIC